MASIEKHIDSAKESGVTVIKVDRHVYEALVKAAKAGKRLAAAVENGTVDCHKDRLKFEQAYQRIIDL